MQNDKWNSTSNSHIRNPKLGLRNRFFPHKIKKLFCSMFHSFFCHPGPQHAFEQNVGDIEISALSTFQPCTTSGGRKNAPKPKRRKTKTLNDRLPLQNWSYRPQSLATHVSDYPQHLMFRRRTTFFSGFFRSRKFVFRSFGHMTRMITCDHNMIIL